MWYTIGDFMFDFDLTDELKVILHKLSKKDRKKVDIINKKIKEIINCNHQNIDHYKNLRYGQKHLKRVHINGSFVLTFSVNKERNFILFVDFDHHDNIY